MNAQTSMTAQDPWELDLHDVARKRNLDLRDAPTLLPQERAAAIATWHGRMANETRSARVFAALRGQARDAGLGAGVEATLARFEAEEHAHGELCAAAAYALGGEARTTATWGAEIASHDVGDPLEALLRNVLSISCMSETVAVALIQAERLESGPKALAQTLRTILADEIGHARFGWSLLDQLAPRLGPQRRARLSAWLPLAFGHLEQHELRELAPGPAPSRAASDVGICDGDQARALFFDTVRDVVIPGLERRGLAASWAWQRRISPEALLAAA